MKIADRDPQWGNGTMWAALDPKTGEILAHGKTLGPNQEGKGLAHKASKLGREYVLHFYAAVKESGGP